MANPNQPSSGSRVTRRRRVEMRRIENEDARHVCFSKRRVGLFRKASELSTLCGADIAIIVNSPTGRPYSFGCPAVDPVINQFLSNTPNQLSRNPNPHGGLVNDLNQELMNIRNQLDEEQARKPVLDDRVRVATNIAPECEWFDNIEELQLDELARLFDTMCQTKAMADSRMYELQNNLSGPLGPVAAPPLSLNRIVNQFELGPFNIIPRSLNPLNIPNPNPASGFLFGLINLNTDPNNLAGNNNMNVPYQPSLQNMNQQGELAGENSSRDSGMRLNPMLIRFNQFNSDLIGTNGLSIAPSWFHPSSSGSNLDPNEPIP